jgi:hypothetical protein
MSRFITEADYDVLIRTEIKNILLENYSITKLQSAEQMAISQIKNYLAGRYNVELIFTPMASPSDDQRNAYIVMITIDCALYHLYCSIAPNRLLLFLQSIQKHHRQKCMNTLGFLSLVTIRH